MHIQAKTLGSSMREEKNVKREKFNIWLIWYHVEHCFEIENEMSNKKLKWKNKKRFQSFRAIRLLINNFILFFSVSCREIAHCMFFIYILLFIRIYVHIDLKQFSVFDSRAMRNYKREQIPFTIDYLNFITRTEPAHIAQRWENLCRYKKPNARNQQT